MFIFEKVSKILHMPCALVHSQKIASAYWKKKMEKLKLIDTDLVCLSPKPLFMGQGLSPILENKVIFFLNTHPILLSVLYSCFCLYNICRYILSKKHAEIRKSRTYYLHMEITYPHLWITCNLYLQFCNRKMTETLTLKCAWTSHYLHDNYI